MRKSKSVKKSTKKVTKKTGETDTEATVKAEAAVCPFCGKKSVTVITFKDHMVYTCCNKDVTRVELISKMQREFEPKMRKILGDSMQSAINQLGQDAVLLSKDDINILATELTGQFHNWFYETMVKLKKSEKDSDLRKIV